MPDGGVWPVASHHDCRIVQRIQKVPDGRQKLRAAAARQIAAPDRAPEQGVAGDQQFLAGEMETAASWCMAGRMDAQAAGLQLLAVHGAVFSADTEGVRSSGSEFLTR